MISGRTGWPIGENSATQSPPTDLPSEQSPTELSPTEDRHNTPTISADTIPYASLDPESKEVFDAARKRGQVRIEGAVPDQLYSHEFVRYNETNYRVEKNPDGNIARTNYAVRPVSNDSINNTSQVTEYENLSWASQQRFKELRSGSGTTDGRIPTELTDNYIRFNGTIYETEIVSVEDIRIWVVEVREVG